MYSYMDRCILRHFRLHTYCLLLLTLHFQSSAINGSAHTKQPNIVLIMADDMGWGDLASYGHPTQENGPLDTLASEGIRFTQMYSGGVFCTPSRAALLTGRLAVRSGMYGDFPVFMSKSSTGLPTYEVTLAEALKGAGYITGMVGKWHLGINAFSHSDGTHLPHNHGFDYVGTILPFTLDPECDMDGRFRKTPARWKCFLYYNDTIVQQPIRLERLTSSLVRDAKAFIHDESTRGPFFLYFSLPQTHSPMFNHPDFQGRSKRGVYGDQVNEMAWAVGEVIDLLHDLDLAEDTLVVFASDHGPQRELCLHGGSAGPFRGGKSNFLEGGLRVPAIAWWPGVIPPGLVSSEVFSLVDLTPTLVSIAGASLPDDRIYDGRNHSNILLSGRSNTSLYLMAVRYHQYKIHFRLLPIALPEDDKEFCLDGEPLIEYSKGRNCSESEVLSEPLIYNVEIDPEERFLLNVSTHHQVLVGVEGLVRVHLAGIESQRSQRLLDKEFHSMSLTPCCNPPYCTCNY